MTTVQRWTGAEARAVRLVLRLSVRAFAAHLGVGVRTVATWEAEGANVQPRPEMQAALDTALHQADDETQARFWAFVRPELAATAVQHEERRTQAAVPSRQVGLPAAEDAADELRERLASAAAVDEHALALLTTQVNHIREIDRMLGARAADAQLHGHLATLKTLRAYTIGKRDALADLYADAATLAGWQCLDLGQLSAAGDYYEAAKDAGREGCSPATLAHALAEQAYVLVELGEIDSALQLAAHARAEAERGVAQLLVAWLWAVEGEMQAVAGNDLAGRRAFDAAATLLPADCRDPELPFVVLSDVHLARWRGNAWAKLGDAAAIDDLHQALTGLDSTFVRAKAGMHVDLAQAFAATKQDDQAGEHLREAETLAVRVGSARQRRRIRRFLSALGAA